MRRPTRPNRFYHYEVNKKAVLDAKSRTACYLRSLILYGRVLEHHVYIRPLRHPRYLKVQGPVEEVHWSSPDQQKTLNRSSFVHRFPRGRQGDGTVRS